MTGDSFARLSGNAVRTVEWRNYVLRGEPFTTEFLRGERTGFCPLCLAEDDARGPAARERRGRLLWLIRSVRTCPRHRVPLVDRPFTGWLDRSHQMALRVPERGDALLRLAVGQERSVSRLQCYIASRLEGRPGPAWLDGQTIEQAARATEMLGIAMAFDRKVNLGTLPETGWETAAEAGFPVVEAGPEAIRHALSEIQRKALFEEMINGNSGPQKVFGRLYQWLNFNRSAKDERPIREILREHILDTMAVEPGTRLLGSTVVERKRHTVGSLAKEAKVHPKTLRNALNAMGVLQSGERAAGESFPVAEGDRVLRAMREAIPQTHLPAFLNTTRGQVEQLLASGLIPVMGGGNDAAARVTTGVARSDAEAFLSRLRQNAREISTPPEGFLPVPQAAEKARVTAADIVRDIIGGRLERAVRLADVPGYGAIQVDPAEVMGLHATPPSERKHSVWAAGQILGLSQRTLKAVSRGGPGEVRLLTERSGPGGAPRVRPEEIKRFRATFVTLFGLSRELGRHHLALSRDLAAAGVMPAGDPTEYGATIYRRVELPNRL